MNETHSSIASESPSLKDPARWAGIDRLRSECLGLVILQMESLELDGKSIFTPREAERAARMGPPRRKSFTAARAALKMLVRRLDPGKQTFPDRAVETLASDGVKPCLADLGLSCSVSHSSGFVAAVADRRPVGVDLEAVSGKALRVRHLFLSPGEQVLLSTSGLSPERTAVRAWTLKEAAAKALDLPLIRTFREVKIVRLVEGEGALKFQERIHPVRHAEGDGFVLTLVVLDDAAGTPRPSPRPAKP